MLGANVIGADFTGANVDLCDWRGAVGVDEAVGLAAKWVTAWQVVNGPPRDGVLLQAIYIPPPDALERPSLAADRTSRAPGFPARRCGAGI